MQPLKPNKFPHIPAAVNEPFTSNRNLRLKWEMNSFTTVACKELRSGLYTKIHIRSQEIMEI